MLSFAGVGAVIVAFAAWGLYLLTTSQQSRRGLKQLPGPKGYPFIGAALELPREYSYWKLKKWGEEYGPIYMFKTFGVTHVVITKHEVASELLSRRGAIYSERFHLPMNVELINHSTNPVQTQAWPNLRKLCQATISSPANVNKWRPWQEAQASRLILHLIKEPDRYGFLFEIYSATVAVKMTYGMDISKSIEESNHHVETIMEIAHATETTAAPGAYLVDILPILKYLPEFLAGFKTVAKYHSKVRMDYFNSLLSYARKSHKAGQMENPPCAAQEYLRTPDRWNLTEDEVSQTLGTVFEAGSGTTSTAMQSFCLAMCHYPEWQARLQAAVDDVVGPDRLPTFDDLPHLPMVRAVAKEVLRWRPVVPNGVPHCTKTDDNYEGYYIPKGAIVHANFIAMARNEADYPDPETFNPDRWLSPKYPTYQEPLTKYPNLDRYPAFGYGRRICAGMQAAENNLFIEIATVAWACNIVPKKDANGKDIPIPWYDYHPGNNPAPKKFAMTVTPRDVDRIQLVEANVKRNALVEN